MPRASRAAAGGFCYHVLSRGNGRAEVFHKDGDYDAFVQIIAEASLRIPTRLLACRPPRSHRELMRRLADARRLGAKEGAVQDREKILVLPAFQGVITRNSPQLFLRKALI